MKALRRVASSALLLMSCEAQAQSALGFAELRLSLFPGAEGETWQVVERVRPTFDAELSDRVKLIATVEAAFDQGRDLAGEVARATGCSPPDHANRVLRIDDAGDYLDVDRLYLDVYAGPVDVRAGRQALNWGSAQFFNPTDPFPEVLLAEPWRPRRGVNAIRATVPFGEAHDVSAVLGTNDVFQEVRAAGRVRVNWAGTDFALVGAWRGDDDSALVGLDLRGTLLVGWWVEGAYFFGDDPHEEIAAGIDYSFPILERAILVLQYYRNGAGSPDPSASPRLAGAELGAIDCDGTSLLSKRDPFAPFTTGRDYLLVGATLAVDPELSLTVSVLQNLNDGSGFAVPTVSYAVLDWLEASFSAQVPYTLWGRGGELSPRETDPAALAGLVPDATLTFWSRMSF